MRPFGPGGTFRLSDEGVRRLAIRGAAATILSSGAGLTVQVVATVVLARLLTPADFGVVAMATTFSLLLANFGLNGFTEAIIQREQIDHQLASNTFWINLGCGVILAAGFAAAGSTLAGFYGDTRVKGIAIGLSATILITALSVLHLALLKRIMRFTSISACEIASRITGATVSIGMATAGWDYWALVAGAIAQPLVMTVCAWWLCRWVPGWPARHAGTGAIVRFAIPTYGRFSLNYLSRNTDHFLLGWRFGAQSLGFYKRAYDLFILPVSQLIAPLTTVAVSALSRLTTNPYEYKRYLLNMLAVVAFVGMAVGADLTLVGEYIIYLLLGPGWEPAGRIFTFFGPGIGVMLLYWTHGWIHLSLGRADRWFCWGVLELAVTTVLFVAALPWGPAGVAVAWGVSFWILLGPAFAYAGRPINLTGGDVLAVIWKYVAASAAAGGMATAVLRAGLRGSAVTTAADALFRTLTTSLVFLVLYLIAVVALYGSWKPVSQLATLVGEMIPRARRKRSGVEVGRPAAEPAVTRGAE